MLTVKIKHLVQASYHCRLERRRWNLPFFVRDVAPRIEILKIKLPVSDNNEIKPGIYVDITSVIDIKERMLCCHKSQRDWLLAHHGMDEYVESMKRQAEMRGRQAGCKYAEGFRQHLGHSYPQDNILKNELKNFVKEK